MREFLRSVFAPGGMEDASSLRRFETLARNLETLSSPTRLEILHALRAPRALHEIRVTPSLSREGESEDRPLSRQAVTRHLDVLVDAGLVRRTDAGPRARGDAFVLNHERLFAVVDEMRNLAKMRPLVEDASLGETIARSDAAEPRLPSGPRVLLAFGRDDGVSFSLAGPSGPRWTVGRAPACEIRLDYDPFLSSEHAAIERSSAGAITIEDLDSRNGTWVNWSRLKPRSPRPLAPGDLISLGRSVLVYQP